MTCKDAIGYLRGILNTYEEGSTTYCAIKLAIVALQMQDGNLYLRYVSNGVSIGRVQGNVY